MKAIIAHACSSLLADNSVQGRCGFRIHHKGTKQFPIPAPLVLVWPGRLAKPAGLVTMALLPQAKVLTGSVQLSIYARSAAALQAPSTGGAVTLVSGCSELHQSPQAIGRKGNGGYEGGTALCGCVGFSAEDIQPPANPTQPVTAVPPLVAISLPSCSRTCGHVGLMLQSRLRGLGLAASPG